MTPTPVPVAAPGRLGPEEGADVASAIERVVASGTYVGGPEVEAFEAAFAATFGPTHRCVGVGCGLDALTLALLGLGLPTGGLVLVPANDAGFACSAALAAGLRPVLMDCGSDGNVGLDQVEEAWRDGVVAVVVTHLHGLAIDLGPVVQWCHARDVRVIEDCAQAHGAVGVGALGDAATFSFYPTKNLGALGDAGAVVTRDPQLAQRVRALREYGWGARYRVDQPQGRNSRLDALQAAILAARLPHLSRANARRRRVVAAYRAAAPSARFLARDDHSFVAHHAVVVTPRRAELAALLTQRQIGWQVHYPYLVGEMPGLIPTPVRSTPMADALRRQMLSLPCFPGLADDEVARVAAALADWESADA